ncbi:MAG TPA: hypothetical protein PKA13_04770 [Geminicoccaceae bacterium]|nr:hypothetical protein [Geminicoccus sp.]HMU49064.1 hypothetical protein [Geminicoccaceae bacterium]
MRTHRILAGIILPAAFVSGGLSATAEAGQRTGRLSVSVQVVDSCASTSSGGTAGHSCAGSTTPVAIVRENPSAGAASRPQVADAVTGIENEQGMITIIY